eukprot:403366244
MVNIIVAKYFLVSIALTKLSHAKYATMTQMKLLLLIVLPVQQPVVKIRSAIIACWDISKKQLRNTYSLMKQCSNHANLTMLKTRDHNIQTFIMGTIFKKPIGNQRVFYLIDLKFIVKISNIARLKIVCMVAFMIKKIAVNSMSVKNVHILGKTTQI